MLPDGDRPWGGCSGHSASHFPAVPARDARTGMISETELQDYQSMIIGKRSARANSHQLRKSLFTTQPLGILISSVRVKRRPKSAFRSLTIVACTRSGEWWKQHARTRANIPKRFQRRDPCFQDPPRDKSGKVLWPGRCIRLEKGNPVCLACADLDHLEFLPRRDRRLRTVPASTPSSGPLKVPPSFRFTMSISFHGARQR